VTPKSLSHVSDLARITLARRAECLGRGVGHAHISHGNLTAGDFMETILTPCRVPWAISPTDSGLTLSHSESMVEPKCTVVLGAGRLQANGKTDDRRIEIAFERCYYARTGPHSDMEDIEAIGYQVEVQNEDPTIDYLDWREREWRRTGYCPDSGFYVAKQSAWISSLQDSCEADDRHYVLDGRDGYVELIARYFRWWEWLWIDGHRELAPSKGPEVAEGEGTA